VTRASPLADALAHLDDGELIALTRDLVRIPSVVRPGDPDATEAAVASYVAGWLAREGLTVEVQQVAPGRPNVLGWIGDPGAAPGRTLLLEGHTDVVTEGDAADWTFPPFGGVLAEGRIWGRGAADMKGGLAAAMVAAAAIRRSGVPLGGRLLVGALVDEEGDMLGVRHLCETPAGRALTGAIICEPEGNELCLEQRGVVWARVTARGRMAHGAMPEAAVNPIAAIAAVIGQAPALERRLRRLCARSRHVRPPTVTPTIIRSPLSGLPQSNVIPSSATATLDIRLTPGVDEKTLAEAIDETCQAAAAGSPSAGSGCRPASSAPPRSCAPSRPGYAG
jgi:succinyl-diaminopimelate desuccinylase